MPNFMRKKEKRDIIPRRKATLITFNFVFSQVSAGLAIACRFSEPYSNHIKSVYSRKCNFPIAPHIHLLERNTFMLLSEHSFRYEQPALYVVFLASSMSRRNIKVVLCYQILQATFIIGSVFSLWPLIMSVCWSVGRSLRCLGGWSVGRSVGLSFLM